MDPQSFESVLRDAVGYVVPIVEVMGAIIVVLGVLGAFAEFVQDKGRPRVREANHIRLRLGRMLVLALEFQVAADILKTALGPTWEDIGRLAALIAIRSAVNHLLEHVIRMLDDGEVEKVK